MSNGTVMAFVFRDAHGISLKDYLERSEITKTEYYAAIMDRLSL